MSAADDAAALRKIANVLDLRDTAFSAQCELVERLEGRVKKLEVALRRAIMLAEHTLPYVMWDGLDGGKDQSAAQVTLGLMKEALEK